MPCEAIVYGFFSPYQLPHIRRCDVKGTTIQILKAFLVTPGLKACKRYYYTVHIFVVTLLLNHPLSLNNICIHWLILNNFTIIDAQRAKVINSFKSSKQKLLKTNAAIWFDKICKIVN